MDMPKCGVGSYLLLNIIFHWLYSIDHPVVFIAKSIVIFVRSIVLLANHEARSMRYNQKPIRVETCNARSQLPNIQCELIG